LEALKAEDDTKTYKWEYFIGKYGHFTAEDPATHSRTYGGGLDSIARWSHGGMKEWGQTCGIPISAAMVVQLALPDNQTEHPLDEIFANYGSAIHPQTDVSNAEWFYTGVHNATNIQISRMPLKQVKVGSMQCHNAIEQFIKLGKTYDPLKKRQEWCGRQTADQCYITLKAINKYYHGTAIDSTPLSPVPATCKTAGCHEDGGMGRTLGKEDCLVCHK